MNISQKCGKFMPINIQLFKLVPDMFPRKLENFQNQDEVVDPIDC